MPETVARAPSVVCLPAFMTRSATPSVIDPLEAGPLIVTGTLSRERFVALQDVIEAVFPAYSPPEPVSPKALRENLNTGRNAANSRFFSDCYNRAVPGNHWRKKRFRRLDGNEAVHIGHFARLGRSTDASICSRTTAGKISNGRPFRAARRQVQAIRRRP